MSVHAESLEVVRVSRCAGCWRRDGGVFERDAWAVGGAGGEKAARSAMGAVVLGIGLGRAELCWWGSFGARRREAQVSARVNFAKTAVSSLAFYAVMP